MPQEFVPITDADLEHESARVITADLADQVSKRATGHCIRVDYIPEHLIENICNELQQVLHNDEVVILGRANNNNHVTSTKLVELRNRNRTRLIVFIPPAFRTSAEDSFDVNNFERLVPREVLTKLETRLLEDIEATLPTKTAERAEQVVRVMKNKANTFPVENRIRYLLAVARNRDHPDAPGLSLSETGLLPDLDITKPSLSEAELARRIDHNHHLVGILADPEVPATQRIRRCRIDDTKPNAADVKDALLRLIQESKDDPRTLAESIAKDHALAQTLAFSKLPIAEETLGAHIDRFDIDLDLDRPNDCPTLNLSAGVDRMKVSWMTEPTTSRIPSFGHFAVQLQHQIGDEWRTVSTPKTVKGTTSSGKRTKQLAGLAKASLETGVYRVNIAAYDAYGKLIDEAQSEEFVVLAGEEQPVAPPVTATHVTFIGAAKAHRMADLRRRGIDLTRDTHTITRIKLPTTASRRSYLTEYQVSFKEGNKYKLQIGEILRHLEEEAIRDPGAWGRYQIDPREAHSIVGREEHSIHVLGAGFEATAPEYARLRDARTELFQAIRDHYHKIHPNSDTAKLSVSICDLEAFRPRVEAYIEAYIAALGANESAREALLRIDTADIRVNYEQLTLISPLHPLRLAWFLEVSRRLQTWTDEHPDTKPADVLEAIDTLLPDYLPPVLPSNGLKDAKVYAEELTAGWAAYLPTSIRDPRATLVKLRTLLGLPSSTDQLTVTEDLETQISRYLARHPTVNQLVLNILNPGDATDILEAILLVLEKQQNSNLRFRLRFFSIEEERSQIASAFDELMREGFETAVGKDTVNKFITGASNPLVPRLSYSKHAVNDLEQEPEKYEAHLTLFLDYFKANLAVVQSTTKPVGGGNPWRVRRQIQYIQTAEDSTWLERFELPTEEHSLLHTCYEAWHKATAPPTNDSPEEIVLRSRLTPREAATLNSAYQVSDWVLIVDPRFGPEYLEQQSDQNTLRYVIDYIPSTLSISGRSIVASTAALDEIKKLIRPELDRLGIPVHDQREARILKHLATLGGGLVMKLTGAPTAVKEALGLAIAHRVLTKSGSIAESIIIPLDHHQDLLARAKRRHADASYSIGRTDLLVIEPPEDPRALDFHIVEAKYRKGATLEELDIGISVDLTRQLDATENDLRVAFIDPANPDAKGVHAYRSRWELAELISTYVERGVRFNTISLPAAERFRDAVANLNRGVDIEVTRHTVVSTDEDIGLERISRDNADMWLVGAGVLHDFLTKPTEAPTKVAQKVQTDAYPRMQTQFKKRTTRAPRPAPREATPIVPQPTEQTAEPSPLPEEEPAPPAEDMPPGPAVLLGTNSATTNQWGILGQRNDRTIGLDLAETLTVSLFGVQGGGKSYTLGTILEMATKRNPPVNHLPKPLCSIVFHYSNKLGYEPEFLSAREPNHAENEVKALREKYGVEPAGIEDVTLLVPERSVEERRLEFPNVDVRPIKFPSTELTAQDWNILLGTVGSRALYVNQISALIRKMANALTIGRLKEAVEEKLSGNVLEFAKSRLEIAEEFIDDEASLAELVKPGRLIIVDFRDPTFTSENALALFVILFRLFVNAKTPQDVNRLVVFDEAHKYLEQPDLVKLIVEDIREMRHAGLTILIASQDPPSVPVTAIELSNVLILHKFNSPQWLKHIQKAQHAAETVSPSELNQLKSGEAYIWAAKASDPQFAKQMVKVNIRPRFTQHGGSTKKAA